MWGQVRVGLRARENRLDLPRWLARRPVLAIGIGAAEAAEMLSNKIDYRLKLLAQQRVAAMVGCEFCLDIGAALAQPAGLTERELLELNDFEISAVFDELDKLVLRFATALTEVPVRVPEGLRAELVERLGKAGLLELAAAIAHEHERTRLYLGLGIRPARFAPEGACRVPAVSASVDLIAAEAATSETTNQTARRV
jgi:AhpD family alkylhydroperoxidase